MVNPVTGPTLVQTVYPSEPRYWAKQQWVRKQVKPYNLDLPYKLRYWSSTPGVGVMLSAGTYSGSVSSPVNKDSTADAYYSYFQSHESAAISKAIASFNKKQGVRASLGQAMAEAKQAQNMIVKRVAQVYSVFKALKRFDITEACNVLGLTRLKARKLHQRWVRAGKRGPYTLRNESIWKNNLRNEAVFGENLGDSHTGRRRSQAVGDLWLEFSFGWMPLVGDIHTAMEVISESPYYLNPIKAGGRSEFTFTNETRTTTPSWYYDYVGKHSCSVEVSVGGMLTVTNSSNSLLYRLGLTNPAMVAYELVTLSFVANYFVNIEEFLTQFAKYDGVTISQSWYTVKWLDTIAYENHNTYRPTGVKTLVRSYGGKAVSFDRTIGSLPTVTLGLRHSYSNTVNRALNNASLLVQLLKRK